MKKILIRTDLIISNFTEIILNVIQIHNNWNSYFINNFDDVMKSMKSFLLIFIFIFSFKPSFGVEMLGKSIKCETQRKTIRGYPFFFFFENETNVKSFFISNENLIQFHNLDYKDIEPNFIEIKYVGKINKSDLILIHTKGRREYICSFLPIEEKIYKELNEFIDN